MRLNFTNGNTHALQGGQRTLDAVGERRGGFCLERCLPATAVAETTAVSKAALHVTMLWELGALQEFVVVGSRLCGACMHAHNVWL